jgi:hypothetical protein
MALRLEYSFDLASLPTAGVAVDVTDAGGGPTTVTMATGVHTHTDISSVDSDFSVFATAFKTALDAAMAGTHTITWNGTTGYAVVSDSATFELDFSSAGTQGTQLRQLLGFSGDLTGSTAYSSDVRPYYLIIPIIQGRTRYKLAQETPEVVNEKVADDGSRVFIAKTTADKVGEWMHVAEIETTPGVFSDVGTPVKKTMVDAGTSANDVPWSWEHSFEHLRTHHHRVLVIDGAASEVWEVRADGMFDNSSRWSGEDQPLHQVPFKGRRIGTL